MLLQTLLTNPIDFIITIISLIIAVTIHEFAHAFIADKLGDPTPRINDRVTLDPRAHIDPLGAIALLIVGFGWGKPVPFDPYNLANPKKDSLFIALAGPASNLILATIIALIIRFTGFYFLLPIMIVNISLAIFNLLPIPPLDGSQILTNLIPNSQSLQLEKFFHQNHNFILIFFILPIFGGNSLASILTSPVIDFILHLLFLIINIPIKY